jgi:hypothetical protein
MAPSLFIITFPTADIFLYLHCNLLYPPTSFPQQELLTEWSERAKTEKMQQPEATLDNILCLTWLDLIP